MYVMKLNNVQNVEKTLFVSLGFISWVRVMGTSSVNVNGAVARCLNTDPGCLSKRPTKSETKHISLVAAVWLIFSRSDIKMNSFWLYIF